MSGLKENVRKAHEHLLAVINEYVADAEVSALWSYFTADDVDAKFPRSFNATLERAYQVSVVLWYENNFV